MRKDPQMTAKLWKKQSFAVFGDFAQIVKKN